MRRIQVSGGLFACVVAVYIEVAPVLFLPGPVSRFAGQEAWLAVLLAGLGGMGIGLFAYWVAMRHPGLGPAQMAQRLLGKWLGSVVGLAYVGFFVWIYSLTLRDILDFSQMILLPGTPGLVVGGLFSGICLYAVWHSLEPVARVSFQTLLTIVAGVLVLPLLEAREFSIQQIDPFLYRGIPALLRATVVGLPWFGESLAIMSLVPHLKHPQKGYRWFVLGMGLGVGLLVILVAQTMLVFGPNLPDRFVFPIYYMTHLISIAKIIERVELLLVTVWLSGMFIKSSLYLFITAEGTAQVLGLKSHRWPAVVFTVVGLALAHVWTSPLDVIHWNSTMGSVYFFLGMELGFPLLLLIASLIRPAVSERGSANA